MDTRYLTQAFKYAILGLLVCMASCSENSQDSASQARNSDINTAFQPVIPTTSKIDQMKAILFDNPQDFAALSDLADLLFESTQFPEAIKYYDRAIAVNPQCADCMNDKGLALHYTGQSDAALESIEKAITIDPGFTHAWLSKGYILLSMGRSQEAVMPLNKVKELDGNGALAAEADNMLRKVGIAVFQ